MPDAPADINPWLIAISVVLPTFMEVIDTSIASVALPHIAGSLSATTDEATWVLTSYLVANAIVLPASSWFALRFGRKRFLITCIVIFTIASFVCGAATSLGMILVARAVQGAGGGALQPISQAILMESFPPEKRGSPWHCSGWAWCRASPWADSGRVVDGHLLVALGVLHQYSHRGGRDPDAVAVRLRPTLHQGRETGRNRCHRPRVPGALARRAADHPG